MRPRAPRPAANQHRRPSTWTDPASGSAPACVRGGLARTPYLRRKNSQFAHGGYARAPSSRSSEIARADRSSSTSSTTPERAQSSGVASYSFVGPIMARSSPSGATYVVPKMPTLRPSGLSSSTCPPCNDTGIVSKSKSAATPAPQHSATWSNSSNSAFTSSTSAMRNVARVPAAPRDASMPHASQSAVKYLGASTTTPFGTNIPPAHASPFLSASMTSLVNSNPGHIATTSSVVTRFTANASSSSSSPRPAFAAKSLPCFADLAGRTIPGALATRSPRRMHIARTAPPLVSRGSAIRGRRAGGRLAPHPLSNFARLA